MLQFENRIAAVWRHQAKIPNVDLIHSDNGITMDNQIVHWDFPIITLHNDHSAHLQRLL